MQDLQDLVIVGGGIAGLSAAIHAASEGLSVSVLEGSVAFGGQTRMIKLIRNLVGYPHGISGKDLVANTLAQARLFGVKLFAPHRVLKIEPRADNMFNVHTSHGASFVARSVLITAGVRYRRLEVVQVSSFLGHGVMYGELPDEIEGEKIYIVGGGNSAGQAAVALTKCADCEIHLLIRGALSDGHMSQYLRTDLATQPKVTIHEGTEVVGAEGFVKLERLVLRDNQSGSTRTVNADKLLIAIGAEPHIEWASDVVVTDAKGFIATGHQVLGDDAWKGSDRPPFRYESSPGIFVAGDIESGSTKRVAAAVGGATGAIASVLFYLKRR